MIDNRQTPLRRKPFTGFHATLMFVAFFGVIMAVNFVMASLAIGSFSGTVVDNSYVASQKYNQWLAESRAQNAFGWRFERPVRKDGKLAISAFAAGDQPLTTASVTALADHPVGRTEAFTLSFSEIRPGQYQSVEPLPDGRWKLKITIEHDGRRYHLVDDIQ